MKRPSPRDAVPARPPLHLAELLDFRPDKGIIRLHEQRVVILSAAAMGLMRKELVDTLGADTARRLLLRFGFADGYHDAVNLRARSNWRSPLDGPRAGAMLHTLEGIVRADVRRIDYDDAMTAEALGKQWHWSFRFPGEDGVLGASVVRHMSVDNPLGVDPEDTRGHRALGRSATRAR